MTKPTPAELLRAAADLLRELLAAVPPEPWERGGIGEYGWTVELGDPATPAYDVIDTRDDGEHGRALAAYIAAMGPGVGRAIAAWLDEEAARCDASVIAARRTWGSDTHPDAQRWLTTGYGRPSENALAVAHAILDDAAQRPAAHATRPQERPGVVGAGPSMPDTESGAQAGAGPSWPDYVIVSQYRHPDTGVYVWAARCWGTDQCRGVVSLGHDSERWAEVALARHLSEEHGVDVDLPEPAAALGDGRDCPACDARIPHDECCPTPESHGAHCIHVPDPGDGLPGKRPFSSPPQDPTANLLRDAERYLSALHTRAGRHEILGADFTCAGCQLADRIRQHLDGTGTPPDAVGLVRPEQVLAELRARLVAQHKGAMSATAASSGDPALIHDGERMGIDVAVAELDALALRYANTPPAR